MSARISVLIVDDHKIVREGLKAFLAPAHDFDILAEAENGRDAVLLWSRFRPDVTLMDLVMPELNGVEATRQIRQHDPAAKVLIITSFVEEAQVIEALKAGASGYVLKDATPQEIEASIRAVAAGESAFPARIASILIKMLHQPQPPASKIAALTEREREVLKLLGLGLSNQAIADTLFLSAWTVRAYVTDILTKLEVENRTQAALCALREGLITLDP